MLAITPPINLKKRRKKVNQFNKGDSTVQSQSQALFSLKSFPCLDLIISLVVSFSYAQTYLVLDDCIMTETMRSGAMEHIHNFL